MGSNHDARPFGLQSRLMRFLIAFTLVGPLYAQDAQAILERLLAAQKVNGDRIQPYTFVEEVTYFTYSDGGTLKQDETETREIIFWKACHFANW